MRQCYATQVNFGTGGPTVTIQWYFVPDGTPFVSVPGAFQSRRWADQPWVPQVGEVGGAATPWKNGKRVRLAPLGTPIGTPDQWRHGANTPWPTNYVLIDGVDSRTLANVASWLLGSQGVAITAKIRARARGSAAVRSGDAMGVSAIFGSRAYFSGRSGLGQSAQATTAAAAGFAGSSGLRLAAISSTEATAAADPIFGFAEGAAAVFAGSHYLAGTSGVKDAAAAVTKAPGAIAASSGVADAATAVTASYHSQRGSSGLQEGLSAVTSGSAAAAESSGLEDGATASLATGHKQTGSSGMSVGANATMSAFGTSTPPGGCGSLPTSMVVRYSGGSGQMNSLYAGLSVTVAYNSTSHVWQGTRNDNLGHSFTTTINCNSGTFQGSFGGSCSPAPTNLSGTTGASPNLTCNLTTGGCTGSVTMTVTRT